MAKSNPSGTRDPGLDLLRALATCRVFLWHATGWAALSWIGAIPVMFYLNGLFFARSVAKRGYKATLQDRAVRLFIPFWVFSATAVLVMALYSSHAGGESWPTNADMWRWFIPILDPHGAAWQQGWISRPLWYLRAYLWVLIAAPLLLWCLRRAPRLLLSSLSVAVVGLELVVHTSLWEVQDFVLYAVFFLVGVLVSEVEASAPRWLPAIGGVLIAASLLLAMALKPEGFVANNSHTVLLVSGTGWLLLAIGCQGALANMGARISKVLGALSSRSLSVYLYHAPMLGIAWVLVGKAPVPQGVVRTIAAAVLGAALTWAAVGFAGWAELPAGSSMLESRALGRMWRTSFIAASLGACVLLPSAVVTLPPTPSRAPTSAIDVTPAEAAVLLGSGTQSSHQAQGTGASPANQVEQGRMGGFSPPPALKPVPEVESLAPAVSSAVAAELEELLSAWVTKNEIGAVEVAFLKPGVGWWRAAVDAEGASVKPAPGVQFASVTKSFTGSLVLRAIDEGRLSIDQELGILAVAPWFTLAEHTTIRELLTHQSGIVSYSLSDTYKVDWHDVYDWESALKAAEKDGLLFQPGSKTEYSSTNFILLGLLLEETYGVSVEDLIQRELLEPLGLIDTKVLPPSPGAPGSGTGNMFGSMEDTIKWGFARWREASVLGQTSSSLSEYIGAKTHLGLAEFGYCPCRKNALDKRDYFAAVGHDGGEHTLRWYRGPDVIVSIHTNRFADPSTDAFIADVIRVITAP